MKQVNQSSTIRYEFRTEKATTPLTFSSEADAREWKEKMSANHPFFTSLIKLHKVTVTIEEEQLDDDQISP